MTTTMVEIPEPDYRVYDEIVRRNFGPLTRPVGQDYGLTAFDEFAGAGGSSQGLSHVPYVQPIRAANHNELALASHSANFPLVDHVQGDITATRIERFGRADVFWCSPACPPWTDARGKKRDFDQQTPQVHMLPGMPGEEGKPTADEETLRARKLMEEVPRYLSYWQTRGKPILVGVVENVVQCRKWAEWDRWIGEIKACGYEVRIIAFNSMHADAPRNPRAPQSRDRLYVAFWLKKFGRIPDWDKWLRPRAYCPGCDQVVLSLQVFKQPGVDMGRYGKHGQYVYRCPNHSCRGREVEPLTVPAAAAIDWSLPGTPIGERAERGMPELKPATVKRIQAGLAKYARPLISPAGGTWQNTATPIDQPMPTRLTRECDGLAVPLIVPTEGRPGKVATPVDGPMRTMTTRRETGIAFPPFVVPMRGGGDKEQAREIGIPLHTVTAGGNHHGLVTPPPAGDGGLFDAPAMVMRNNSSSGDGAYLSTPVSEPVRTITTAGHQSLVTWGQVPNDILVPYYRNGYARPVADPVGTVTTKDRWALVSGADGEIPLDDVRFRMLETHEIQRAMAFPDSYIILGNAKRHRVRQLGNAVTPPVAELIVSALVEMILGEELERGYKPYGLAA